MPLLGAAAAACAALVGAHPGAVVVTKAKPIASPRWSPTTDSTYRPKPVDAPFCRVEGTIEGNIGFELWLPDAWNGRLLGAGVGGDAGQFNYADLSIRSPKASLRSPPTPGTNGRRRAG